MPPRVGIAKKIDLQPEGRKCRYPGCNATLSRYNPGSECHSHHSSGKGDPGASRLGGGNWTSAANGDGHR